MELGGPQESRVRSHSAVGAMKPEPSSDPWGPRLCYREGQVGLLSRYSMQLPLRGLATPPGGTPEMVASEGGRPSAPEQVSKRVSGQVSAGDECTAARDKMGSSCVGPCPSILSPPGRRAGRNQRQDRGHFVPWLPANSLCPDSGLLCRVSVPASGQTESTFINGH